MALFSDQTIVVTGASGGIGEAIVRTLGKKGATVCLSGRDRARLRIIAAKVPGKRGRCYPADLTVEKELQNAVRTILAENQRVDALIHCAAIIVREPLATSSAANFDRQFKTNVLGPFRLTQLLMPALVAFHLHQFQRRFSWSCRSESICCDETRVAGRGGQSSQ